MAVRTRTALAARIAQNINDNNTGDITAADLRDILTDIIDSMLFDTDATPDATTVLSGKVELATPAELQAALGGTDPAGGVENNVLTLQAAYERRDDFIGSGWGAAAVVKLGLPVGAWDKQADTFGAGEFAINSATQLDYSSEVSDSAVAVIASGQTDVDNPYSVALDDQYVYWARRDQR